MTKPKRITHQPNQSGQRQVIHAQQTTIYRGQLPPPEMLERFEAIQPGFTNRLLTMVEEESKFKRDHDKTMFSSFKLSTILGIVCAFLAVLVVSCVAIFAIYKDYATAGATIMSTCVVGVIIAFIQRRKRTQDESK